MAKGSFLSVKRGKLGDAVGYRVSNSNDGEKQGWRVYQPAVRNPQTDGQMVQRVKLAAVNNLYRDLKEIIRRSFENKKYGDESRRAWLSMALGQQFEGPWITKGTTLGLPILGVPISVGSLQPIATNYTTQDGPVYFFLPFDSSIESSAPTVRVLTEIFVMSGYQEGDQVTFVMGYVPMRQAFAWKVVSFFLDSSDTTPFYQLFGGSESGVIEINEGTMGDVDGSYFDLSPVSATPIDAMAVIVSRDGQTAGSHLRSTAHFAMNPTAAANWYSEGAYEIAKRSYLTSDTANSNWEQDPNRAPAAPGETRAMTNAATPAAITVDGWRDQDGFAQVHDATNQIWRYVYNEDVVNTGYHKYLSSRLSGSASSWSATAPAGAVTTEAVRFVYMRDATAQDIAFGDWLMSDVGYSPRGLLV